MCNVLMILERSGKTKSGEADLFFRQFLSELPPLFAAVPLLPRALEIAKQFRQTVYDCLYVALAEREGCELVTADDKLVNAVQPTLPFVVSLSSLP
jgi:predicted nucleic acid-binding protein